ncbi:GTP cyclohydrolase 1 type 2 homolog YbgI [hydrothermal vent metagenome]|uniref:GTP cyclohydrolase 1 type 2 homolog YbgI n=1 Tax=hydrothermal vent metagenome TaxID=652676 RepID=A0A3B0X4K8_9ZZZZ
MTQLKAIEAYCNGLLQVNEFRDYCPNGLQVEGRADVKRIISGVTASQALIECAVEKQADAILVHHGYFWKGENETIVGIKRRRIQRLLENNISLLAYHLPLDAHPELGNNAMLAQKLVIQSIESEKKGDAKGLLWRGELAQALSADAFSRHIEQQLGRSPLHLPDATSKPIKRVGWCTGGAQHYIEQAAALGLDAYISGEVSEQTFHLAAELDIHYFAAGHHATERYGVQALADKLSEQFGIEVEFVNVHNPV